MEHPPYLVHTNRELGLMLAGRKPLAHFSEGEGFWPDCLLRYFRLFDRHVATGRILRAYRFRPNTWPHIKVKRWHHVFFALPGEEHRIEAMWALKTSDGPWTDQHERREGLLYGYTPEQCDWWIAQRQRFRKEGKQ